MTQTLSRPYNEMKLKPKAVSRSVLRMFCFSFISLYGQFKVAGRVSRWQ